MYLKSLEIRNFRKFSNKNNFLEFVDSKESLSTPNDINVAKATSLIVGKNNAGKTTTITALDKIVNSQKFNANDFNFIYLNRLLKIYSKKHYLIKPSLYFKLIIGIDERNHDDIVNNLVPFMKLENNQTELTIIAKYELKNDIEFDSIVNSLITKYKKNEELLFSKFLSLLNKNELFNFNFYGIDNQVIKDSFNIKKLIHIVVIKPNENQGEKDLSKLFAQIIKYKYGQEDNPVTIKFQNKIEIFNAIVSRDIKKDFTNDFNDVVGKLQDKNTLEIFLSSNLDFIELLNKLVQYKYKENNLNIPENQFGLGYRNLMRIIGELIDYVEQYPEGDKQSKLNLICIEEPEVFMHPQMQELFINHIKEAINTLLGSSAKKLNSQLIISTHSAHILNSKIHTSNSLNNINYVYEKCNFTNVVNLKDSKIISKEKNNNESDEEKEKRTIEELNFIKKHIKFKASELFFADAVIFVEGITEEVLLKYYLSIDEQLNKKYITIFNINGAHGLVYHHLIKLLAVPTLVITDLDIKRSELEKESYLQINSLSGRSTTNNTIRKYNTIKLKLESLNLSWESIPQTFSLLDFSMYRYIQNNSISLLNVNHFIDNNLYVAFQGDKIEDIFATSLEESLILTNYDNEVLNNALYGTIRNKYLKIIGKEKDKLNLVHNSYRLQKELSDSKSDFANELLYQLSINEDKTKLPKLPNYIEDALEWLKTEFGFTQDEE